MDRRAILVAAALAMLFPEGAACAGLVVKTRTPRATQNFWIVRDMDLQREQRENPRARLEDIIRQFRRRPINGLPLPTKPNVGYTVYPECSGRMKLQGVPADGGQPSVWVDC